MPDERDLNSGRLMISAVIPTRDRPQDLVGAVESILRQTRLPNELIIVDQSAGVESKELIMNLCSGRQAGQFELVYIHDQAICGLVAAKDVAVTSSRGDIILFLEDDVILDVKYVENMVGGFHDTPQMMGSSGVILEMPRRACCYRAMFHLFHRGIFYDRRVDVHGNPGEWERKLIQSNFLNGGVSAYRREGFEKGKFDTKNGFFMLEDIDFSTRAAREFGGDKFFINTSARLLHTFSPANRAVSGARYEHKLREYVCFYKKNCDQAGALPSFLWLLVGLSLEAILVSVKLMDVAPVIGAVRGLLKGVRWQIQETHVDGPGHRPRSESL